MTAVTEPPTRRRRGTIDRQGPSLRVRVTAGKDPTTGERIVLTESVPIAKPGKEASERAAAKQAEKVLTRLLSKADGLKVASKKATFGALLDRWLPQHEVDRTTWGTYESIVRLYLKPELEDVPLALLTVNFAERMERYYSRLRKCGDLCKGRPSVEHKARGKHDCQALGCKPHVCRPLAASYIHRIHAVVSAALAAGARWGWIDRNPADTVKLPPRKRAQPRPPSAEQMARIIEAAWRAEDEWGLYIWLSAVTGARRGELLATRLDSYDLENNVVELRGNYVWGPEGLVMKDTKTHQARFLSLDEATAELVRQHKRDCAQQLLRLGLPLTGSEFAFSQAPDRSKPRDPSAVSHRYARLLRRLKIESELRQLRHYSATELLTAGVDLRTVAGRLGHGDGSTTLRHYAAWVRSADQQAAATIGARMPAPPGQVRVT